MSTIIMKKELTSIAANAFNRCASLLTDGKDPDYASLPTPSSNNIAVYYEESRTYRVNHLWYNIVGRDSGNANLVNAVWDFAVLETYEYLVFKYISSVDKYKLVGVGDLCGAPKGVDQKGTNVLIML